MSALVAGAKQNAVPATKRAHAQHGVVAQPDRVRVADERSGRSARDEPRAAHEQPALLFVIGLEARESRAVAPRRDLREQRGSDAHELEPSAKAREPDVVGRHPQTRAAEETLAFVDRLPAFLERREIPPPAPRADHPQPSLLRVVRQPAADGKRRQKVIRAEVGVAEETGGVHAFTLRVDRLVG